MDKKFNIKAHAPTPWQESAYEGGWPGIRDKEGRLLYKSSLNINGLDTYTVRAVNCHEGLVKALKLFADAFETDFILNGEIVDSPAQIWRPIVILYRQAKAALLKAKGA